MRALTMYTAELVGAMEREYLERDLLQATRALAEIAGHEDIHWNPDVSGDMEMLSARVREVVNTQTGAAFRTMVQDKYINVGCNVESAQFVVGICEGVVDGIIPEGGAIPEGHIRELTRNIRNRVVREFRVSVPFRGASIVRVRARSEDEALDLARDMWEDDPVGYIDTDTADIDGSMTIEAAGA